ncbi:M23 family metallopeptidase [Rheinheimera riviphila]|uniref:M23 family metallopeptidase n=1 Tax=Rheinheimera riviphila TaxID=1834037 RepID=A0A437R5N6_9GAMM|nr:M23 family metallopeptidase [Rheinheimera riviphila]RVU42053.1 M23 family metallopeptidase [Rheinheimera riviphila]
MKTRNLSTLSLLLCSLSVVAATPAILTTTADAVAAPTVVHDRSASATASRQPVNPLIYSYDEMFNFDIEAYLASQAPHLLPYAEQISHWAGYSSISPRVLMALMEQQSGVLRNANLSAKQLAQPFGKLSAKRDFAGQLQDVADQLATRLYTEPTHPEAAEFAKQQAPSALDFLFASATPKTLSDAPSLPDPQALPQQAAARHFNAIYQQLFAEEFSAAPSQIEQQQAVEQQAMVDPVILAGPANGFLQFPFPTGQSWHVGGAHTNTGSGNYPMSSLDLSQGGGWGSNQSSRWVAASAAGSFKRHSSCFAEVVHSGGWSTTYYHLMNIQFSTGATVSKNTKIANPANTQPQALCNGGSSTGPHQHWSLKQNGSWTHLNGVYVSGWQITATGSSYDTNCSRYYLTKNGSRSCAGYFSH